MKPIIHAIQEPFGPEGSGHHLQEPFFHNLIYSKATFLSSRAKKDRRGNGGGKRRARAFPVWPGMARTCAYFTANTKKEADIVKHERENSGRRLYKRGVSETHRQLIADHDDAFHIGVFIAFLEKITSIHIAEMDLVAYVVKEVVNKAEIGFPAGLVFGVKK